MKHPWFASLALLILSAPPAAATTLLPLDDATLVDYADLVVRAEVLRSTVRHDEGGRIVTDTELRVVETVLGEAPEQVTVRVLGGVLDGGEGFLVWGAPRFAAGAEYLLFLTGDSSGPRGVVGFAQGVFVEVDGVFLRPYGGAHVLPLADEESTGRDRILFLDWVHDRREGDERAPDYFRARPAEADRSIEKYRLVFDDTELAPLVARWTEFDSGGQVVWRRHVSGQAGLEGGGEAEFRRALAYWSDEPNTPVRLVDGGTTTSASGFGGRPRSDHGPDGNTILFADLANDIDDCTGRGGNSGFVAVGGARIRRDEGTWKGRPMSVILEAEVVVNTDARECLGARFGSLAMEWVYTHELGHTLGLGHPCGGEVPCVPRLSDAVMNVRAGRGGPVRLGADDVEGLRFLYDPSFSEGDACQNRVGAGNFCDVCGPCSHGEGDCDDDADCSLTFNGFCDEDAGVEFGLGPNVDVCRQGALCNLPGGHPEFCDRCGLCDLGHGDCDRDSDCLPGLVCADDVGPFYGYGPNIDVCIATGTDSGCNLSRGHPDYCDVCGDPCFIGDGDCDRDADCELGLVCGSDLGARFGYRPAIDVCVPSDVGDEGSGDGGACSLPAGDGDYCRECAPCAAGEGDCDRDSDCASGLTCMEDIGAQYGFGPGIDVCR